MKKSYRFLYFATVVILLLASSPSYGIPAFARKFHMECAECHEPPPRLNEYGYKFRAAGFRRPDEIGKNEATTDYTSYVSALFLFTGNYTSTAGSANNTNVNQSAQENAGFQCADLYPLCGTFGGHISSWTKFGYTPSTGLTVSDVFARFTYGDSASFWSFRVGLFNFIEGYGASDASISPSSPLISNPAQTIVGNSFVSTLYTPGAGEAGIEGGWNYGRLSVHAGIGNGGYSLNGTFQPAIEGSYSKPVNSPSYDAKDYMFFVNYMLDEHGGGIGAYGFTGTIDLPNPLTASASAMFPDRYERYGVYVSSPEVSGFKIYAGVGMGTDKEWIADSTILPNEGKIADSSSSSMGYYIEPNYKIGKDWNVGARYDYFDPMNGANYQNNELSAITVFANWYILYAEIQQMTTLQGMDHTNTMMKKNDYSFTLQAFIVW